MAESTEHQCINEEQSREFAIQQIVETALRGKFAHFVAVCDHCRNLIKKTIHSVLPNELSRFNLHKEDFKDWGTKLEFATDELSHGAESYLKGKQIIQEEGLDLNDATKTIKRLKSGLAIYYAKKKLFKKRGGEMEKVELGEMFYEIHVCFYLTALLSRDMIKTVLGDEAHLAEHAHVAKEYSQST